MQKAHGAAAIVLAGILTAACDRPAGKPAGRDGVAGTSGRAADGSMSVMPAFGSAEPPVFVSRDREGPRLWNLTRQFYQKRGDAPAWIENRKPRPQMDELIKRAAAQPIARGSTRRSTTRRCCARAAPEAGRGFLTMKGFNESRGRASSTSG